jgi:hypothetical protein
MDTQDYQNWDTDEMFMFFCSELDLMPDEDKLKENGIDGSTL